LEENILGTRGRILDTGIEERGDPAHGVPERHGGTLLPYWHDVIAHHGPLGKRVLIAARKHQLCGARESTWIIIPDDVIPEVNIPTGCPGL